jgi:hypothetical protein
MYWRTVTWTSEVPPPPLEPSLSLTFDESNDSFVVLDWSDRIETNWADVTAASGIWTDVSDTSEIWTEVG